MGQWFGGRSVPTGAIRAVGVAPQFRAKGIATHLLSSVLEELRRDGIVSSTLYPATQPLYRRAGFELAGTRQGYSVPAHALSVQDRALELRTIERSDQDAIREVYAARARRTAGNLDRNSWLWQRILEPAPWGKPAHGFLVMRGGRVEGYAVYSQAVGDTLHNSHALEVVDWAILTPEAARRLLTFLCDHRSMVNSVNFFGAPADPLTYLLTEQKYSARDRNDWMLRIVDVRGALEARGYPAGVEAELHVEVNDDILTQNQGRYILAVGDSRGRVREGGRGDLSVDIRGLATMYTGYLSPTELLATGRIEGPQRDVDLAGAIFAGPCPWMPDVF
jgi:predicted acetyltransferase